MPTITAIDAYIKKANPFAQPILIHLRKLVHQTCPTVEEKIKWGMPSFEYKGLMCGFAAFKEHCVFSFWKASLMSDPMLMENARSEKSMGHFSKITSLQALPTDKKIIGYIKEAMKLNDDGIKVIKAKPITKKELVVPAEILSVIKKTKKHSERLKLLAQVIKKNILIGLMKPKPKQLKRNDLPKLLNGLKKINHEIGSI